MVRSFFHRALFAASVVCVCPSGFAVSTLLERSFPAILYCFEGDSASAGAQYAAMSRFADSLVEGVVLNSALNGLGTKTLVGSRQQMEGVYTQGLRVFSAFDWKFTKLYLKHGMPVRKESKFAIASRLVDLATLQGFADPDDAQLRKLEQLTRIFFPKEQAYRVRRLVGAECDFSTGNGGFVPTRIRDDIYEHISAWQNVFRELSRSNGFADSAAKLKLLTRAFLPFYAGMEVVATPIASERSGVETVVVLPPIFSLETPNETDVSTWYLKRGFREEKLAQPIDVANARITDVSYLPAIDPRVENVIELRLTKRFAESEKFFSQVVFGRVESTPVGRNVVDAYGDDALVVTWHPRIGIGTGIGDRIDPLRKVKEHFNAMFRDFVIDARIHRLGLSLERPLGLDARRYNPSILFRPRFLLAQSKLSFRVHHQTNSGGKVLWLRSLGFLCRATDTVPVGAYIRGNGGAFYCFSDFATFDDLKRHFFERVADDAGSADAGNSGGNSGGIRGDGAGFFAGTLGVMRHNAVKQGVRMFTRFVVPTVIPSIEAGLDKESDRIMDALFSRATEAQKKISGRLQDRLF